MVESQPVPPAAPSLTEPAVPGGSQRASGRRGWLVALVVILVLVLGLFSLGAVYVFRSISSSVSTLNELRPLVANAYPDYRVVDSTISGLILRHESEPSLVIDVRFFGNDEVPPWLSPEERVSLDWRTQDTFFRHSAFPDPVTSMTYDVPGFVNAYEEVRPGPNSVVSSVWYKDIDPKTKRETYIVLAARRDRGEDMWPDHLAYFTRDPESGVWTPEEFKPVEVPHNEP